MVSVRGRRGRVPRVAWRMERTRRMGARMNMVVSGGGVMDVGRWWKRYQVCIEGGG